MSLQGLKKDQRLINIHTLQTITTCAEISFIYPVNRDNQVFF